MQRMKLFVTSLSIVVCCSGLSAQKIDSVLGIYAEQYQQEKLHLQFDKATYNKGETIWFKAYLMTGTDLSEYSKNLYVDWYDVSGKLLKHTVAPIFRSSAKGQFEIPAAYTGQVLHLKAYTQWMLNFDSAFLFNKDISVSQVLTARPPQIKPIPSIQFFPEGGDLVQGLSATVAFKAVNQFGKPVNVRGAVKNTKGELIDSFTARHDGMGVFTVDQPDQKEKYTASWVDETGKAYTSVLPAVKEMGATIQVQPLTGKTLVAIKRTDNATASMKSLNLIATMNQQVVYRSKVNLAARASGLAEIPTETFPTAVMQITLFTSDWIPLAERVVFVNNHQHEFYSEVNNVVKNLGKRGRNAIEVYVSDTIACNMSIAVTDAGLGSDSSNNIMPQLLLCGDIKGAVYHPDYYFASEADSLARNLDLVMLTHGWRRFKWDEIVRAKMPVINYPRETEYLQIKGKVFGNAFARSSATQSINVILAGKDTSSRQKEIMVLPVDKDGSFVQHGAFFYDTLRLFYMFNNDRSLTNRTEVRFQNGLLPTPKLVINDMTAFSGSYLPDDSSAYLRNKFFYDQATNLTKLLGAHNLEEVIVHTKAKSPLELLDDRYASGLFAGNGDGYQFDIANDPIARSAMDVFRYLQGRVAGLTINTSGAVPTLSWRGGNPSLFLNEMNTQPDVLTTIPMTDVAYIKIFRPPFFGAPGGGSGGAIAVYTLKGSDSKNTSSQGLEMTRLGGYTTYKEFYSPDYSVPVTNTDPDLRTTIYWNPYVLTTAKSRVVRLEFYNNDLSKKLRIILEGVNAEGKLTRIEKVIQ